MAIVKPGPMVGAQRGTVGTVVLQGGPYGCVAHAKGRRCKTETGMRGDHLDRFYAAVGAWRRLSRADRLAWGTWAAAGKGVGLKGQWGPLSGRQAFMQSSIIQTMTESTGAVAIPLEGAVAPLESFSVVSSAAGPSVVLTFAPAPLAGDEYLLAWVAIFRSTGTRLPGLGWQGPMSFGAGMPSGIDAGPMLASVNDSFQEGRKIGLRLAVYSSTLHKASKPRESLAVVSA